MPAVLVTGASGFVGRVLCAALGLQGNLARATRTSPEGSENLARQAARAGVRRFVFLSSVKVNGEDSAGRAFVETDPVMPISNLRSLVYVGNLVHALSACLTQPAAANRTFFVSDDHDVSTPQLIREIAVALGKKPLLFPFPPALLRGAGLLMGRAEQIARLTGSLQVDVSSIKTALDWQPPFSLQQGLAQTVSWYRSPRR